MSIILTKTIQKRSKYFNDLYKITKNKHIEIPKYISDELNTKLLFKLLSTEITHVIPNN